MTADGKVITADRTATIKYVTWVGLFVNLLLSALKCILGYIGSSQAVIADGIHSLSDLITDLSILIGVKYWSAPADGKHPYGHHRYETIVTVIIGGVLAIAAFVLGYNALFSLHDSESQSQPTWVAAVAALISIILKEVLYRWTANAGARIKSSSIIANAQHHRSDALSSIPTLIAVLIAIFNPDWRFVDKIGAMIVSAFILKVAYEILKDSLSGLIDTSASETDRSKILELVLGVDGVKSTHKIRTRKVGYGIYVDLHIQVEGSISVTAGHDISRAVSKALIKNGPDVLDVITHIEPYEEDYS